MTDIWQAAPAVLTITDPQPVETTAYWQRLAVLQTEREHIGRQLVRSGNHAHTIPTPDVKRYYTLNNLIREALGL